MSDHLIARARAWLSEDPDPDTRAELQTLLDRADVQSIGQRFSGRLEFGTAGLRGPLGAGPTRMNRVVVIRAAAGLSAYLKAHGGKSVVIGYDARHKSDVFARDTAAVATGAGLRAYLLPYPTPTPVLAFAIRHLGADSGVMVTASHNPPQDNGYKVYLGDGSQIVPPADADISAAIDAVGPLDTVPRTQGAEVLGEEIVRAYVRRAVSLVAPDSPRELRIVYTPLHGVGRDLFLEVLTGAGFPAPYVVPAQGKPDPDFPTVSFPNPEEPGALDLALAAATGRQADLVIANDPDADRCAVAVSETGTWRMLRGDELGALLGMHILGKMRRIGDVTGAYAASIVSSSLLGKIAAANGLRYEETLTGFKWIGRVEGLRFGYEEALGYCTDPAAVRDKDGVSAALLVAELAAQLKSEGRSLPDLLNEIAREYGLHATDQLSLRFDDISEISAAMQRLREAPPKSFGGYRVAKWDDLESSTGDLPATDGLRYYLESSTRVIVRPSGTEPKLKCYLETVVGVGGDGDVKAARGAAAGILDAVSADVRSAVAGSA